MIKREKCRARRGEHKVAGLPSALQNIFTKFGGENLRNIFQSLMKFKNLNVSDYADARHIFFINLEEFGQIVVTLSGHPIFYFFFFILIGK